MIRYIYARQSWKVFVPIKGECSKNYLFGNRLKKLEKRCVKCVKSHDNYVLGHVQFYLKAMPFLVRLRTFQYLTQTHIYIYIYIYI